MIAVENAENEVSTTVYDAAGQAIVAIDGVGNRTSIRRTDGEYSNWTYSPINGLGVDIYINLTAWGWKRLTLPQWSIMTASDWSILPDDALSGVAYSYGSTYSAVGNRTVISDPFSGSDSTTYTYDAANRMLTSQSVSGTTSYTYDANGNQASTEEPNGDITTNTWDDENRLVQVEHPDNSLTTYAYNADGQRVLKESPAAVVTWFVHDEKNVLLEIDDADAVECEFTYDPQAYAHTLSQRRDGDSSFYHFDGTMNTAALTDATSIVTDEYVVDALGKLRSSTGSTANSQIYKGEYLAYRRDPDTGPDEVYTLEYRHYGPSAGRFNSLDPAEDDLNLYRYVENNPVNEDDPSGLGPPLDMQLEEVSPTWDREHLKKMMLESSELPESPSSTHSAFDASQGVTAEQLRNFDDLHGNTIDWTKVIDVRTGKPVRTKKLSMSRRKTELSQTTLPERLLYILREVFQRDMIRGEKAKQVLSQLLDLKTWGLIAAFLAGSAAIGALTGPIGVAVFTGILTGMGLIQSIPEIIELIRIIRQIQNAKSYSELEDPKLLRRFADTMEQLAVEGAMTILLRSVAKVGGNFGKNYEIDPEYVRGNQLGMNPVPFRKRSNNASKTDRETVELNAPTSAARTNAQLVEDIGTRAQRWAQRKELTGTARQIGTRQHTYARDVLRRYQRMFGDRGLRTEASFLSGDEVRYGLRGSVRADVLDPATGQIWDYKFGTTPMTQRQIQRLLDNVKDATSVTPVYRP